VSDLEEAMAFYIKAKKLPTPEREFSFLEGRRYRMDFAWPELRVALEVEGGSWVNGAHGRGKHFESDCRKYSLAAIEGWVVVRATTDMVKSGEALDLLERALESKGAA
jgi:very-short-patch-repair endonuclease